MSPSPGEVVEEDIKNIPAETIFDNKPIILNEPFSQKASTDITSNQINEISEEKEEEEENSVPNAKKVEKERELFIDKISHCHCLYQKGYDIDIGIKNNIFKIYEQKSGKLFFGDKKYIFNKPSYAFIDEHFLYILNGVGNNKHKPDEKRIREKYDLFYLFDYENYKRDNNCEFIFEIIDGTSEVDRITIRFLVDGKDADRFKNELNNTLEKIDSIYLDVVDEDDIQVEEIVEDNRNELNNEPENKIGKATVDDEDSMTSNSKYKMLSYKGNTLIP